MARKGDSYELPMQDGRTVDVEAASQECPRCGQRLSQEDGRCRSRRCERRNSQAVLHDLIDHYERLMEG